MSILACGVDHWISLTERGGLMVRRDNAEGQLGIGTRNSEWYPTDLGGIGSVVGDEVGELVRSVHTLALLAATQAQVATLPAGVLAHPFDDKVAMVSAGEEHTLCVTDGGVVYAWGSNFEASSESTIPRNMRKQWVCICVATRSLSGGRITCATGRQRGWWHVGTTTRWC